MIDRLLTTGNALHCTNFGAVFSSGRELLILRWVSDLFGAQSAVYITMSDALRRQFLMNRA